MAVALELAGLPSDRPLRHPAMRSHGADRALATLQ